MSCFIPGKLENTFAMPTTVSFTDTWDNQCAALEARSQ